ncbi:hypothetical protein EMIT07CA2_50094 [Brevibacillus sp. IT-7CA2]
MVLLLSKKALYLRKIGIRLFNPSIQKGQSKHKNKVLDWPGLLSYRSPLVQ